MLDRRIILIPTDVEAAHVRQRLSRLRPASTIVELCGFGPAVAAARTMQVILQLQPSEVVLVGIAGALDRGLQVGEAYEFSEVVCYGIGVGCGEEFKPASQLGWKQWSGSEAASIGSLTAGGELESPDSGVSDIGDRIYLESGSMPAMQLLTCCAASASADDVRLRRQEFPDALAEDMEGFAVAAAGRLARTKVRIIRGISNFAGDRNPADWKIAEAMEAAFDLLGDV